MTYARLKYKAFHFFLTDPVHMMPSSAISADWFTLRKRAVESAIDERLACYAAEDLLLRDAMQYACAGGGKRLRALLVLGTAEVVGAGIAQAMPAACAVEALHAYSLVHDDLPCMDDDDLRRGKPSCHKVYGEAMALLAGDALQTLAFEWLVDSPLAAAQVLEHVRVLSRAAGARGMAAGQSIDLQSVNRHPDIARLKQMHACKTGALFRASVDMGALCAPALPAQTRQALEQFSEALGLAFQVIDDIIDVCSPTEELGKTAGKDAVDNKPTTVSLLGLDAARELADQLAQEAGAALQSLDADTRILQQFIAQVVERRS
jgi:farnesyl diphosphate synthase